MNYLNEIKEVIEKDIILQEKQRYYRNESLVKTYFEVGRLLIEAQGGKERAKYGNELIKKWSIELTNLYGKGYNYTNLKNMRQFYIVFEKSRSVSDHLNWTNLRYLLPIKDINKRNYYINICNKENLSSRQLISLIKSKAYERLNYKDKENISILETTEELNITDMIKSPIIINTEKDINKLSEKVLKELIIEKIEVFLRELGSGFAFIGSEYKLGTWYCDLLFFNYSLNCFVVIEVKLRKLIPKDIGQIECYMNYIDKNIKKVHHNETIGIILCKEEDKLVMKYCSNSNIFSSKYLIFSGNK